jgi:hypothetical protein
MCNEQSLVFLGFMFIIICYLLIKYDIILLQVSIETCRYFFAGITSEFFIFNEILAVLCDVLDPAMFVLGGGISKAGAFLLDPVRARVKEHIFYKDMPYGAIELAQLGSEAGIIGAAMVSRKALA